MELTDILTLVKAGYTRNEIEQMESQKPADANPVPAIQPVANPEPVPEPANVQTPVAEPVLAPVPAPVPAPVQQSAQTPVQNETTLADIMQGIAKLTSAVQANAIAQSVIPQGLQNPPSAEDMLAEIIRPTFKERG